MIELNHTEGKTMSNTKDKKEVSDSGTLITADLAYGIAQRVASQLFKNGFDEKGRRLVITTEDGKDLGGWCKGAVIDRIADEILAVNEPILPANPNETES